MSRTRAAAYGLLLTSALFAHVSRADADDGVRARHSSPVFWQRVTRPDAARASTLLDAAREWLEVSGELPGGGWSSVCPTLDGASARLVRERLVKRAVATENAIARLEHARRTAPDDTAILYALALATTLWERPEQGCAVSRRDGEARELWLAIRGLDASFEPETVGTELALVETRLGHLESAVDEYQTLVGLTAHAPRRALLAHGNLAELLMMKGDLREAVAHFQEATRFAREVDDMGALSLANFGLAAALDRLGERTQALTTAREAVDRGDDSMRVLRSDGVFFVPAYEVHFYEALGQESRADATHVSLAPARARGSRAESLSGALERALASPLSPSELAEVGRAHDAWLRASARAPSSENAALELDVGRLLASTLDGVLAAASARSRAAREARRSIELRTIDEELEQSEVLPPEARARLRLGCLAAAARSWRRYLDEGGRDGPFADHARAHLAALAELVAPTAANRPAPTLRRATAARR